MDGESSIGIGGGRELREPVFDLMNENSNKVDVTVGDGLVSADHIGGRFIPGYDLVPMGHVSLRDNNYVRFMRFDLVHDEQKGYFAHTGFDLAKAVATRADRGYFAPDRRANIQELLKARGYKVEQYEEALSESDKKRYGLRLVMNGISYDLYFGHQTESDAIAAATSGKLKNRRKARMEKGQTENRLVSLDSAEVKLDDAGKVIAGHAQVTKDVFAALMSEAGITLTTPVSLVFR